MNFQKYLSLLKIYKEIFPITEPHNKKIDDDRPSEMMCEEFPQLSKKKKKEEWLALKTV